MNRPGTINRSLIPKMLLLGSVLAIVCAVGWRDSGSPSRAPWHRMLPVGHLWQAASTTKPLQPAALSVRETAAGTDAPLKYGPPPLYWREGQTDFRAIHAIAKWDRSAAQWVSISPDLTQAFQDNSEGFGVDGITSVAHRGDTWYAGTLTGTIKVMSACTNWLDASRNLPDRTVSALCICPAAVDGSLAVAGFDGYSSATPDHPGHVYVTFDHGEQWSDLTGDLPDAPVQSLDFVNASGRQALVAKVHDTWYAMSDTPMHWIRWTSPPSGQSESASLR